MSSKMGINTFFIYFLHLLAYSSVIYTDSCAHSEPQPTQSPPLSPPPPPPTIHTFTCFLLLPQVQSQQVAHLAVFLIGQLQRPLGVVVRGGGRLFTPLLCPHLTVHWARLTGVWRGGVCKAGETFVIKMLYAEYTSLHCF